jgi:hypothetical protein
MTVPYHRSILSVGLVVTLLAPLSACSGEAIQRALSADPNANRWGQNNPQAIPTDFPAELRYPNATLQAVNPAANPPSADPAAPSPANDITRETRWTTPDPIDQVQGFYQKAFQAPGWTVLDRPGEDTNNQSTFEARREDLQVIVSLPSPSEPVPAQPANTEFVIQYVRSAIAAGPPQPSGPIEPAPPPEPADSAQQFTDLDQAPEALRVYIEDLASLGVLPLRSIDPQNQSTSDFKPNQAITRREYARWLVTVNNRIYRDRPARQIRLAPETAPPAFQDVPRSDPDFPAIQGLAEAGYIPSSLSGAATAAFRPNAPLTREELLLWKVLVDTRQSLPTANLDAVKQTWGFQDAARIEPNASRALIADHQNGDLANIRRAFGSTLLFQPKKSVTRAEAAAALWYIGAQGDGLSAQDVLKQPQANAAPPPSPTNAPGN